MTDARVLGAYGSAWDAADASAAAMRLEAVLEAASNPPSEADAAIQGRAQNLLRTPTEAPVAQRRAANGARVAVVAVPSNGGHGSLAFGLLDHPSIASMVLELPLGPSSFTDDRLIWTTAAITRRLATVLDAVRRTSDLLSSGRRADALLHRREAGTVAKCVETVVAGCWTERGSMTGAQGSVMSTIECPTPWTSASMTTGQNLGGPGEPLLGFLDQTPRPSNSLLDEEGTAILAAALPQAVEISWNPDAKTPDGDVVRRMRVAPMQVMTLITKRSLLDPMETLRTHRVTPIPDHCIRRIGE